MLHQLKHLQNLLILVSVFTFLVTGVAEANKAPAAVGLIPDQTVKVNKEVSIPMDSYFSDLDGDQLTYTAASSDTAKATVSVSGSTVTITAKAVGTATITVTATDPGGLTGTHTISVTVVTNLAPTTVGKLSDVVAKTGWTSSVDVKSYFSDPDGDTLTFSASSSDTSVVTVSVSGATVTLTAVAAGTATVTVTATDPGGLTASQTRSITVGNAAPVIKKLISDQTVSLGSTITINASDHFSDPDGDALTFSASSADTNIITASVSGATVTLTPSGTGTVTITIAAADTVGQSMGQQFDVTITASQADVLPDITSEERARIAASLAMDKVIFNELRNASTDTHDWIELRNISDTAVDLSDWQLVLVTSESTMGVNFPPGASLAAGELLLLLNTDPNTPGMPLADTEDVSHYYVVDADLILPQDNFTLLLRSETGWEDSVGNYFFGREIPPTAPPLTEDAAWYRARPDALGYQAEAWTESGYQNGIGYDVGVSQAIALGSPGYPQSSLRGDVNGDGLVNILDLVLVASRLGEAGPTEVDVNGDGIINVQDLVLVSNAFGSVLAAPAADGKLSLAQLEQWLILAKSHPIQTSTAPRELSYERGIEVLEQMVRELIPQTTALLRNYPNPFNPETWIPYHLAKASEVQITIYDVSGNVVRSLDIGHQSEGYYTSQNRAAYWDGTNEMGETVASGTYFYSLNAGDFSATRKMLILK